MTSCGSKQTKEGDKNSNAISMHENLPGDSAIYGLACDGCTDSLLVFLPYSGGDPEYYDIINARQQHRVFGRPHIGDAVAIMVNPQNSTEALSVINLSTLTGEWCFMAEPTLRTVDGQLPPIPDSILKKIMIPVEYTLKLKADNTAMATGYHRTTTTTSQSPVIYPEITHYSEWNLYNGRLILRAKSISEDSKKDEYTNVDTADIVMLMRDSLVLHIDGKNQSFYRKKEEGKEDRKI